MRGFLTLLIIYFLLTPCQSQALFGKKDCIAARQPPRDAQKRHNNKAALHNYEKVLETVKNLLKKNSGNKKLLNLALEYAIAAKDWDNALIYTDKLLTFEPNSEKLLKNAGDIYSIKKDFSSAAAYYEKLVEYYPKLEYQVTLANIYMADQQFKKAECILEFLYCNYPENPKITDAYLDALLAQQKTMQAYKVVKNSHLEKTSKGYMVFGDMAMKDRNYDAAGNYYFKALSLDPENIFLKNKLALAYRSLGHIRTATRLYCDVLCNAPNNLEAKIGLGYIEIEKKNFKKARKIFCDILAEKPCYKPAELGVVHSYLSNGDNLKALEILNKLPPDADIKLLKAQTYFNIGMYSDALKNIPCKRECESFTTKKTNNNTNGKRTKNLGKVAGKSTESCETSGLTESKMETATEKPEIMSGMDGKTSAIPSLEDETNIKPQLTKAEDSSAKPSITRETTIEETKGSAIESAKEEPSITREALEEGKSNMETEIILSPETNLYTVPGLPEHIYGAIPEAPILLHGEIYETTQGLKYQIKRAQALNIIPSYSLLSQQLADEFDLDYKKIGLGLSKNTVANSNVFMNYNVIIYTSGAKTGLTNVTHEFYGGIQSRPIEKWEYRADLGVKVFEFDEGAMIISNSWIKHYFNDYFNLKLGYRRNNIEQSFLAAVGEPVNGIFTGRAADNKFYIEFEGRLPHSFYAFGRGAYGVIYAQNLTTNQYSEGMIGAGKLLYNNPKNKWINTFSMDAVCYNASYQYNLLDIYNSAGVLFGGYFSPSYYNSDTVNLKLEGNIKKLHLKYGLKSFWGVQTSISPDSTTPVWGISPYISYDLNNHISINASYSYYNYASVQRHLFMVSAVIRGFRK